ncbi:MAG: M23 family metallopeptidase [Actinomycetota bacterium]
MRARRRAVLLGLAILSAGATACGTVSVEVTSETDIDKIDVQTTLPPDDPPVTQTAPPTTAAAPATTLGLAAADETAGSGEDAAAESSSTTSSSTSTTSTTTAAPTTTTTVAPTIPLEYHDTDYAVFALAGDLEVRMPVSRYEMIGFHESGHDGAFQLQIVDVADWRTLASRGRGTGSRTAADIVVPLDEPVYSPIDGTVIRAGSYTLYCDHTDNFIVIEPAGRPGWELKIFHFDGLAVAVGDEVVAATTLIGTNGKVLPFESQVDEFTAEPSNPHVHIEVIDTSIPDRPSSGGGC